MPSGSNAMTAMPVAPHLPLVLIGSGRKVSNDNGQDDKGQCAGQDREGRRRQRGRGSVASARRATKIVDGARLMHR